VKAFRKKSHGFTLIELLIVIAVIAILAALAIPNLLGSRKAANETSAISQLRTIMSQQELFKSRNLNGDGTYGTLAQLEANNLVRWPTAGSYVKSGYVFSDLVSQPTAASWAIKADPIQPGTSGDRYFAASADGFVRERSAEDGTFTLDNLTAAESKVVQ